MPRSGIFGRMLDGLLGPQDDFEPLPDPVTDIGPDGLPVPFATDALPAERLGGILVGRALNEDDTAGEKLLYHGPLHHLCFGPSGVGKGMRLLVPNLLTISGKSLVVLDPKSQLAAMTAKERHRMGDNVKIIDPFGELAGIVRSQPDAYRYLIDHGLVESAGYNPLAGLDPESPTFYDDAQVISEAMIKTSLSEPHWAESAQGLLTGLIMLERMERGPAANLGHVRQRLTEADAYDTQDRQTAGLRITAARMVAKGELPERDAAGRRTHGFVLASLGGRFAADHTSDEMESVRSTADTQTKWLLSEAMRADLAKDGVSFKSLKTDDRPTTVFLILPSRYLETHSVWLRLAVSEALQANMTAGRSHRGVLLIMDEFGALGHLSIVQKLFGVTRDYKVQMMPIFNDLGQLKQLYPERWETLIANSGVVQSFRTGDLTTAKWISERSGQITTMQRSYGSTNNTNNHDMNRSDSENWSPTERPTIQPNDLFGMGDGFSVTFWNGERRPLMVYAPHFTQVASMVARALPNPQYDGPE